MRILILNTWCGLNALALIAISLIVAVWVLFPFARIENDLIHASSIMGEARILESARSACQSSPKCKGVDFRLSGDSPPGGMTWTTWHSYFVDVDIQAQGAAYASVVNAVSAQIHPKLIHYVRFSSKG